MYYWHLIPRHRGVLTSALLLLSSSNCLAGQAVVPEPRPGQLAQFVVVLETDSAQIVPESAARLKSEKTALRYSLIGTLAPTATLILAYPSLLIGPSMGYFYADEPGRAWKGIGIRALATGGMISAFGICGWDCGEGDSEYNIAWAVFLASSGAFVGSAIYDIATVERTVRHHNESLQISWTVAPVYSPRDRTIGLRIGMRF